MTTNPTARLNATAATALDTDLLTRTHNTAAIAQARMDLMSAIENLSLVRLHICDDELEPIELRAKEARTLIQQAVDALLATEQDLQSSINKIKSAQEELKCRQTSGMLDIISDNMTKPTAPGPRRQGRDARM